MHIRDSHDVVVIVDSDTQIEPGAVASLVTTLWNDERCAAACGYLLPSNAEASFVTRLQACEYVGVLSLAKMGRHKSGFIPVMAGAFMAHRSSVVARCGGWGQWIVEDMGWTWRALAFGYRTAFVAESIGWTQCPVSVDELWRQRRRWSRGPYESIRGLPFLHPWRWFRLFGRTAYLAARTLGFTVVPVLFALGLNPLPTLALSACLLATLSMALFADPWRYRLPRQWKRRSVAECLAATHVLVVLLWWPAWLGLADALRGRHRTWLTRGGSKDAKR